MSAKIQNYSTSNFKRGWIIGDFDPSLIKANFEIGIQKYKAGDSSEYHFHKFNDEFNVCIYGKCQIFYFSLGDKINNQKSLICESNSNDIFVIHKNVVAKFIALTDCAILCFKPKSYKDDKVIYWEPNWPI